NSFGRPGETEQARHRVVDASPCLRAKDRPRAGASAAHQPTDRPCLATLHSEGHSEIASTKSWSSCSPALLATSSDWRCAWRANLGERTSGTQSWIGLIPRRRNRARWARTLLLDLAVLVVAMRGSSHLDLRTLPSQ